MSDINPDLVAQEVDDELRRERMTLLWKSYGRYVIGAAVGIVLMVAGREIYDWRISTTEGEYSEAFAEALEAASAEGADAVAVWRGVMPRLSKGYSALAQLRLAAAALEAGNIDEAFASYDALAANPEAETFLRELATLKAAMLLASRQGDLDVAKSMLSTIAVKGKTWYFSALEQVALIDLQQGDMDAALLNFTLLADDVETPDSIRTRARQFRGFIDNQKYAAELAMEQMNGKETETPGEGDSR